MGEFPIQFGSFDVSHPRIGPAQGGTHGHWWAGRILSIITNPVYKGELQYGRRSSKPGGREVITAQVPPLVPPELWQAAQETLSRNRLMVKNTPRVYLLKSVMRCGSCGRFFTGSWSRNYPRYRCKGQLTDRRPIQERCQAKTLRGPDLEPLVWDDIERFLRDPGDILAELQREREMDQGSVIAEAEMVTLESALATLAQRRKKAIDLNLRERISDEELDDLLVEIVREQEGVEQRLQELRASFSEPEEPLSPDLLGELRQRLDEGLTDAQRQEIVQLLVKRITVYTETTEDGKRARVLVQYRFPGVVSTVTGIREVATYAGGLPLKLLAEVGRRGRVYRSASDRCHLLLAASRPAIPKTASRFQLKPRIRLMARSMKCAIYYPCN